jgi:hypothetical protein
VPYSYKFLQNSHTKKLATWKARTTWKKKKKSETKPQAWQSMGNETERERERERKEQEQEQERLEIGRRKWIGMVNHITRECNSNKSNTPKTKKIGERASERARERGGERQRRRRSERARGRGKRCFRKKPQRQSACRRSQCCGVLRVACEIAQVREMAC